MNVQAVERWGGGDRLPNTRLRMPEGDRVALHTEFAGLPLWLCVAGDATVAARLPAPPAGVNALCVGDDFVIAPPPWRSCIADAAWCERLAKDVLWLADANLRLQSCHALPLEDAAPIAPLRPALDAMQTATMAPLLQVPDVFEPELCARLIEHLEVDCGGGEASGVLVLEAGRREFRIDPAIKQRRESPPRDAALEARIHERVSRRVLPELARVFNFQVSRRDPFKLLAYPEQAGYFRPHRDNETVDVAHRRFALSINLNAGAYQGGEFRFPEFGLHRFSPPTGGAIVFSCSLLHEVLPVTRGMRYAMTTFLA